jgi:hypothetical protein
MIEVRRSAIFKVLSVSALAIGLSSCSDNGPGAQLPSVGALTGDYVFSVAGTDPTDGDYFVVGRFTSDGKGGITNGVADYNLGSGIDAGVPLSGSYTVSGGVATISLTDGKGTQDSFTTQLGASTTTIQNFDGTGSGTLYPQATTGFSPVGTYAYTVKGEGQGTVTGSGQFAITSGTTFTTGNLSYMDGASLMNYTTTTGFVDTPQSTGRGQAALVGYNLAYYVVNSKLVLLIGLDERNLILLTATKS